MSAFRYFLITRSYRLCSGVQFAHHKVVSKQYLLMQRENQSVTMNATLLQQSGQAHETFWQQRDGVPAASLSVGALHDDPSHDDSYYDGSSHNLWTSASQVTDFTNKATYKNTCPSTWYTSLDKTALPTSEQEHTTTSSIDHWPVAGATPNHLKDELPASGDDDFLTAGYDHLHWPPHHAQNYGDKPRCFEHGCSGRTFSSRENYRRHIRERTRSLDALCMFCLKSFTRKSNRDNHILNGKCKAQQVFSTE